MTFNIYGQKILGHSDIFEITAIIIIEAKIDENEKKFIETPKPYSIL